MEAGDLGESGNSGVSTSVSRALNAVGCFRFACKSRANATASARSTCHPTVRRVIPPGDRRGHLAKIPGVKRILPTSAPSGPRSRTCADPCLDLAVRAKFRPRNTLLPGLRRPHAKAHHPQKHADPRGSKMGENQDLIKSGTPAATGRAWVKYPRSPRQSHGLPNVRVVTAPSPAAIARKSPLAGTVHKVYARRSR